MPPRYILIANPGTKRCELYRGELVAYWQSRGAAFELDVVPWDRVVPRDGNLDELHEFDRPAIVRIESPGKNDYVTRLLLEAGARDAPAEPPRDWQAVNLSKGSLVRPGLMHRGFRRVLLGLRRSFDNRPHLIPTACPLAIAAMFDKTATAQRLCAQAVPVPEMIDGSQDILSRLRDNTSRHHWPTAYIKLNTGSSATGIVVLHQTVGRQEEFGITTLAVRDGAFFNTRRVRRVSGQALERAVEFIRVEGAIVQRGIPLAQIDGQNFDVRVVCIYGMPVATIFRLSSHPITNLHLGGRRGEYERCRKSIPTRNWLDALEHCTDAASCFDSAIAGVDLVFERGSYRHFILEVNAFGDFFPGWTDAHGRSIYSQEISVTSGRFG